MADIEDCVQKIVGEIFEKFDVQGSKMEGDEKKEGEENKDNAASEQINTDKAAEDEAAKKKAAADDRLDIDEFRTYVNTIIEEFKGVTQKQKEESEKKKEEKKKEREEAANKDAAADDDDEEEEKTCIFEESAFKSCFEDMLKLEKETKDWQDNKEKYGETLSRATVAKFLKKEAGYGE